MQFYVWVHEALGVGVAEEYATVLRCNEDGYLLHDFGFECSGEPPGRVVYVFAFFFRDGYQLNQCVC